MSKQVVSLMTGLPYAVRRLPGCHGHWPVHLHHAVVPV